MKLATKLKFAAIIGGALTLAACVSAPPNRYGSACDPSGRNCTPVVCDPSGTDCARAGSSRGYGYYNANGTYGPDDPFYDPNDPRMARRQVCDSYGRNCYWVSPDRNGRYYDRSGVLIRIN